MQIYYIYHTYMPKCIQTRNYQWGYIIVTTFKTFKLHHFDGFFPGNWQLGLRSVHALPAQGHTGNPGSLLHYQPSDFNPCRENFSCEDLGGKIDGSICIDLANLGVRKSRFGRFWAPHQNFMTEKVVIASIFQPSWVFVFASRRRTQDLFD